MPHVKPAVGIDASAGKTGRVIVDDHIRELANITRVVPGAVDTTTVIGDIGADLTSDDFQSAPVGDASAAKIGRVTGDDDIGQHEAPGWRIIYCAIGLALVGNATTVWGEILCDDAILQLAMAGMI